MKNRGPDDEGYLIASHQNKRAKAFKGKDTPASQVPFLFYPKESIDSAWDEMGSAFFAHRRLSIIDLSPSGHQPMCTGDGRFWIVYNGEIYNYQDIRKILESDGINFVGNSDTEVLLYAYQKWGARALSKLNGMFAFAIWDDLHKELFCARDRIGIKPFYYSIQNRRFIFASDIRTLISSRLYRPQVDIEGLYYGMSFGIVPRPLTAFKAVRALRQGYYLEIDSSGAMREECYWQVPVGTQNHHMSEHAAKAALEAKMHEAVMRRLVADVPVGTFMSGGIDSTTISAIASRLHPGIKAFTISSVNASQLDELQQAKATAAMHPMAHIIAQIDETEVLADVIDMTVCDEEPFCALNPNYTLSKIVAQGGVTVILNGLGGDELFGGYVYYQLLNYWRLLKKMRPLLNIARHFPLSRHLFERLENISASRTADRYQVAIRSFMTDMEKQRLFLDTIVRDYHTTEQIYKMYNPNGYEFSDAVEAVSYMDLVNYIGNHHVHRIDSFTMRFSIEGRLPLLDHELVELAFKIPSSLKIKNGERKYILRRVAEKHIHRSCLKMGKKGFRFPNDQWMRGPLKPLIRQKLTQLAQRDIFNPREIWRIYSEWQLKTRSHRGLWQLVATEIWIEQLIEGRSAISVV